MIMSDELVTLRREFPGFRIWMEVVGDRTRYIARSRHLGKSPHTVVTADPAELLAALAAPDPQHRGTD